MRKLSGTLRFAIIITSLWIMGCFSAFLVLSVIERGLGITESLTFVYLGIVLPFFCWGIYWIILGYTWGIYAKLLGYERRLWPKNGQSHQNRNNASRARCPSVRRRHPQGLKAGLGDPENNVVSYEEDKEETK